MSNTYVTPLLFGALAVVSSILLAAVVRADLAGGEELPRLESGPAMLPVTWQGSDGTRAILEARCTGGEDDGLTTIVVAMMRAEQERIVTSVTGERDFDGSCRPAARPLASGNAVLTVDTEIDASGEGESTLRFLLISRDGEVELPRQGGQV